MSGSNELRPAFVVGGLHTESSGVARIVCDLAQAMAAEEHPVTIFTAVCGEERPLTHLVRPPNRLVAEPGRDLARLAWSPRLKRRLEEELPEMDVVHHHSLWMLPNHYAATIAHRLEKPTIYTAHGFLEPWALGHSAWKKRLASILFQRRDLERAACIQVNSEREADQVRSLGFDTPIVVIPNGVDLAPFDRPFGPESFLASHPELEGKRLALFLSRLHVKKGILELLPAWNRIASRFPDWHLVIAGPDDGAEDRARAAAAQGSTADSVTFLGPVTGPDKHAVLAAAELFLLPSFSEGFSMAILEAMAARLPVLVTPGCNFPEIPAAGAGIEVEPQTTALAEALEALLSRSPESLRAMGRSGRRLVGERYTWTCAARELLAVYNWMLGRAEKPDTLLAA